MPSAEKKTIVEHGAAWLLGQPFNNVMLTLILCAIGWLGWYGLTTAIPDHLTRIQAGYESLERSHRDERTQTLQAYREILEISRKQSNTATASAEQ